MFFCLLLCDSISCFCIRSNVCGGDGYDDDDDDDDDDEDEDTTTMICHIYEDESGAAMPLIPLSSAAAMLS